MHRADLLDVVSAALPANAVTLGRRCTHVESHANGAVARFDDGIAAEPPERGKRPLAAGAPAVEAC